MKDDKLAQLLTPLMNRPDIPEDVRALINMAVSEAINPLKYDKWIYRGVIIVLGIAVVATVFGGINLALKADPNIKLPEFIVAIGAAAVGALAGLLAPSPKGE